MGFYVGFIVGVAIMGVCEFFWTAFLSERFLAKLASHRLATRTAIAVMGVRKRLDDSGNDKLEEAV